jgi:hypothetical protein
MVLRTNALRKGSEDKKEGVPGAEPQCLLQCSEVLERNLQEPPGLRR